MIPPSQRVFLTWDITTRCNYTCSYCPNLCFYRQRLCRVVYPGLERWVRAWEGVHERYGPCHIHLCGGEPFVYPDIFELIGRISRLHTLEFSTNLHWDPAQLLDRVDPSRVRLGASLHPECADVETFCAKVERLREAGVDAWVNFVAYPAQMDRIPGLQSRFREQGVHFSIQPCSGRVGWRRYPGAYTREQRERLKTWAGEEIANQRPLDFALGGWKLLGRSRLCGMGQRYARIYPDGSAYACCAWRAPKLGNLADGTFALRSEPLRCTIARCPCQKAMLPGQEASWSKFWIAARGT